MKKFTILIALILCVSIGGVYATWTYQTGEVGGLHQHFNVYMGALDNAEAKGILQNVANALSIKLNDDEGGAVPGQGDYVAEAAVEGYIEFVFTPKANANDDVRNNGIDLVFNLKQTDPAIEFDGAPVFTVSDATVDLGKGQKITADNADELSAHNTDLSNYVGSFYYCISASQLQSMISTDLELPTYEDYQAMETILNTTQAKIGIEVNEK